MPEQPTIQPTPVGALRFNTDSAKLEYFDGNQYVNITTDSAEANTGGTRGIWGGGNVQPSNTNVMDFVNFDTTGNATDFGDLTTNAGGNMGRCSSRTRGIFACFNQTPSDNSNKIDFVTISSTGNSADFGDLLFTGRYKTGASNSTRGVIFAGKDVVSPSAGKNNINYITIASTGNAVDFGDLTATMIQPMPLQSPTRVVLAGGYNPSPAGYITTSEFFTFSTLGNSAIFGDMGGNYYAGQGASNATRGIIRIGAPAPTVGTLLTLQMATLGEPVDFGDSTFSFSHGDGNSSSTRAVFGGGYDSPNSPSKGSNIIEYVQINTFGNASDFGDLTRQVFYAACVSNGHGGLG